MEMPLPWLSKESQKWRHVDSQHNCRHFNSYLCTCPVLSCACCVETENTHKGLERLKKQTNNIAFCVCLLLVSTASLFWAETLSFLLTWFLRHTQTLLLILNNHFLRPRKKGNAESRKIWIVNPPNCY